MVLLCGMLHSNLVFQLSVEQSFERVNFMPQPDHSYTFVNQQMALQHGGADLSQYSAAAAVGVGSQQNGGFVPPHHHQVALQVLCN